MRKFSYGISLFLMFLMVGIGSAATIQIEGPDQVKSNSQFTISVNMLDIAPLTNLDFWSLGLELTPGSGGVAFMGADLAVAEDPDYIFYGDSGEYTAGLNGSNRIVIADLTISGTGVTDVTGKRLAEIRIDVAEDAVPGLYDLQLFALGSWTVMGDKDGVINDSDISLMPYQFEIKPVPIPAAIWMLFPGLTGLAVIRKRRNGKN